MTTKEQFLNWSKQGYNWIPVVEEFICDLETPLSLYLKVGNTPHSYLLESGFNGETWGRFSIIGLNASSKVVVKQHEVSFSNAGKLETFTAENPLDYIEKLIGAYKVPNLNNNLPRFYGGFVGYFGFDAIRYIEPRLDVFDQEDPLNIPDIYLMLSDEIVIHDNLLNKAHIIIYKDPQKEHAFEEAKQTIKTIRKKINQPIHQAPHVRTSNNEFVSNIEKPAFESLVLKAKDYFDAGDAMQVIVSQRFSKHFDGDPLHVYRALRQINPSPYMYYFNLDDFFIAGASPEILVRMEDNQVTVRPLAGTRLRGKTPREDKLLEKDLLSDAKEIAEHLMLIDLGRNDIGRVCKIGSVVVAEQMAIERFSHVMHISSTVTGEVKPDQSLIDVLKATFPAGTVSGAPKVRAMEIIYELEEDQRGLYGGAIGYLGWNGNMDMAIALRTALIKDKQIHIQAGAGLVADSNPASEWQECINKGKALFLATETAESNFLELSNDFDD